MTPTFHGIQPSTLLLSYQIYLAHITLADQFDLVKAARPNLNIPNLDAVTAVCPSESHTISYLARTQPVNPWYWQGILAILRQRLDHAERTGVAVRAHSVRHLRWAFRFCCARPAVTASALALAEYALRIGRTGYSSQLPRQLFFPACCRHVARFLRITSLGCNFWRLRRIRWRRRHATVIVMSDTWKPLMLEVWIRDGGWAHALV